ncbi:MAG TPA: hypothetical protein VKE26_20950 [Xanthobacteraceae bacterium]|nr:hypothetical protein [Xanthobacteraceae bacterium]
MADHVFVDEALLLVLARHGESFLQDEARAEDFAAEPGGTVRPGIAFKDIRLWSGGIPLRSRLPLSAIDTTRRTAGVRIGGFFECAACRPRPLTPAAIRARTTATP